MTRLPLALVALALVFPASATAGKKCPQTSKYELTKVTNVSCGRAKEILAAYFADNTAAPFGWDCKQEYYEGGATTTCRKGNRKIKHFSAD